MTEFDYIIVGAGAAGLMLADAMGSDPFFAERSILLIDKDHKQNDDRTWCFWEKGNGEMDSLVFKSWEQVYFAGQDFDKQSTITPYTYKMIRGLDFYEAYLKRIREYSNVSLNTDTVVEIEDARGKVLVTTIMGSYTATKVFNSILDFKPLLEQRKYPVLQQHFIGWFIKSTSSIFDPETATFMDFSIPQKGNTRFMYVLPFSENEALVEYTLFSENLLSEKEYENAIKDYVKNNLNCPEFAVLKKEQGTIPMSCYDFASHNTENLMHIGSAGGWSKPSTGYTFMNTREKTKELIAHLKTKNSFASFSKKSRFWYYDLLLLDILHRNNAKGSTIFERLFKNRSPQKILKFLDEKTSIPEDLNIIMGCPKRAFIAAFLKRLF